MKSNFKSLLFWAFFFFLLGYDMLLGFTILAVNGVLYSDFVNIFLEAIGYLFLALYVVFAVIIFINKFPEKIKQFEKSRYLLIVFLLLFAELMVIASALPDFD